MLTKNITDNACESRTQITLEHISTKSVTFLHNLLVEFPWLLRVCIVFIKSTNYSFPCSRYRFATLCFIFTFLPGYTSVYLEKHSFRITGYWQHNGTKLCHPNGLSILLEPGSIDQILLCTAKSTVCLQFIIFIQKEPIRPARVVLGTEKLDVHTTVDNSS